MTATLSHGGTAWDRFGHEETLNNSTMTRAFSFTYVY